MIKLFYIFIITEIITENIKIYKIQITIYIIDLNKIFNNFRINISSFFQIKNNII